MRSNHDVTQIVARTYISVIFDWISFISLAYIHVFCPLSKRLMPKKMVYHFGCLPCLSAWHALLRLRLLISCRRSAFRTISQRYMPAMLAVRAYVEFSLFSFEHFYATFLSLFQWIEQLCEKWPKISYLARKILVTKFPG